MHICCLKWGWRQQVAISLSHLPISLSALGIGTDMWWRVGSVNQNSPSLNFRMALTHVLRHPNALHTVQGESKWSLTIYFISFLPSFSHLERNG